MSSPPNPLPKPTESEKEKETCVICLDTINPRERGLALPCRHPYDYICLLNWLQLRPACPLCNAVVHHVETLDGSTGKLTRHPVEPVKPPPPKSTARPTNTHGGRRRRPAPPERTRIPESLAVLQRRHVYRTQSRCLHVGANRISRFEHFTPRTLRDSEEMQSRARMWVRRELQVFEWTQGPEGNAEFLIEYVLAILKTMDVRSSTGAAEDMMADFLGRVNAGIFWHECHAFLRSPFVALQSFDAFVQYERPLPTVFDSEGLPVETAVARTRKRRRSEERGVGTTPEVTHGHGQDQTRRPGVEGWNSRGRPRVR
ncbi:hypothetical protein EDC01DRAFT_141585 [Geopyxis carbonaria]|nr:hypothetical protein EDC01DRAFT_141585 [Geopyxis carbonaria]